VTRPSRILILERDGPFRRTAERSLSGEGYQCDCCSTCATARTRLTDEEPDLVIASLGAPGNSRLEILRRTSHTLAAPVIIVAPKPSVATAVEALRLGVTDYLTGPVTMPVLMASVRAALAKREALRSVQAAQRVITTCVRWFQFLEVMLAAPGPVHLPPALKTALADRPAILDSAQNALAWALRHQAVEVLSPREREVLVALMLGRRVREIAEELHVSVHTARNHVMSICRKLGVHSQAELRARFQEAGRG
jgi:DNA-binding NarL/FixJ family response regulator